MDKRQMSLREKMEHILLFSCSAMSLCHPIYCDHQAPLSMGFPRLEYKSDLPFPPPGDLPDLGIEPRLLRCRQALYH